MMGAVSLRGHEEDPVEVGVVVPDPVTHGRLKAEELQAHRIIVLQQRIMISIFRMIGLQL